MRVTIICDSDVLGDVEVTERSFVHVVNREAAETELSAALAAALTKVLRAYRLKMPEGTE